MHFFRQLFRKMVTIVTDPKTRNHIVLGSNVQLNYEPTEMARSTPDKMLWHVILDPDTGKIKIQSQDDPLGPHDILLGNSKTCGLLHRSWHRHRQPLPHRTSHDCRKFHEPLWDASQTRLPLVHGIFLSTRMSG